MVGDLRQDIVKFSDSASALAGGLSVGELLAELGSSEVQAEPKRIASRAKSRQGKRKDVAPFPPPCLDS